MKRICVISEDEQLFRKCQEALQDRQERVLLRRATAAEADVALWVWDCRAAGGPPGYLNSADLAKSLFLVDRDRLADFPEENLLFAAAVALLPIDTPRLLIAFEQAFARQNVSAETNGDGLTGRAEGGALLQCFLQANLRLQEYDQDRTNFLNRALHDFRSPLTAITGYCGLLLSGQAGVLSTPQAEVARRVENSAKRLSRLADGMFQLGVRRVKQLPAEMVKGDILSTVEIAAGEVDPILQQKRIALSVQMDEPDQDLFFEPEQIVQLLVNILENACRFSPRRSAIEIKGYSYFWERRSPTVRQRISHSNRRRRDEARMNCYRIDIVDSGPGILPEHLNQIFEEYTSYSGGNDRSGTGLGLAISKGIVHLHHGRIWAEPRKQGATFSFVLPYAVAGDRRELALAVGSGD